MTDLKDILKHDDELNNDELMKYLEGNASEAERFAIEKQMADSDFMNDAVEGLQDFAHTSQLKRYAAQLNRQLHLHTTGTQRRKNKKRLTDQKWTLIAIISILLLCLLVYFVIHMTVAAGTTH